MHDCLVDLYAKSAGKTLITEASGFTPVVEDKLPCYGVELKSRDSRSNPAGNLSEGAADKVARRTHPLDLFSCLNVNHSF